MLKEEEDSAGIATAAAGSTWPSWCDSCRSLPCSVYCRADAAYLCGGCDAAVHSANSLARRHHRVLLLPVPSCGPRQFLRRQEEVTLMEEDEEEEDEDVVEEDGLFLGGEVDEYLDLVEFSSCEEEVKSEVKEKQINGYCDQIIEGIVPVRCLAADQEELHLLQSFQMGYDQAIKGEVAYTDSVVHNVALSSVEAKGMSSSHMITSKGTIDLFSGPPLHEMPHQFSPMDREARVLRYREKRKTRKFQKIIRYASRKAYAETRPRIKGRFAKRTDVELEVDQMFAAPVMDETRYGVVPSY